MDVRLIEAITKQVLEQLASNPISLHPQPDTIPVGISARHVHLSKSDLEQLFGRGYELTKRNDLSMLQEFAAEETVTIVSPKLRSIENVRILGPLRPQTQVEISRTDAHKLGMVPPVRQSGDIAGSAPITLIGPHGSVTLQEGCIIANRHIHFGIEDAVQYGVQQNQRVDVKCECEGKSTILLDVQVRIKETYTVEMHLDTDDANALGLKPGAQVTIIRK